MIDHGHAAQTGSTLAHVADLLDGDGSSFGRLTEFARRVANADVAWYSHLETDIGFRVMDLLGPRGHRTRYRPIPLGRNLGTEAVRRQSPVWTDDLVEDNRVSLTGAQRRDLARLGARSVAVIPVAQVGGVTGILCIGYFASFSPPSGLDDFLAGLARVASAFVRTEVGLSESRRLQLDSQAVAEELRQRESDTRAAARLERQLVSQAAGTGDVSAVLRTVVDVIGHPVTLINRFGERIAHEGVGPTPDPPGRSHVGDGSPAVAVVTAGGEVVGRLVANLGPYSGSPGQRAALTAGAAACAVALAQRKAVAVTELGRTRTLVEALVLGHASPDLLVAAHLLEVDLGRPHRVAVVRLGRDVAMDDDGGREAHEAAAIAVAQLARDRGIRISGAWVDGDLVLLIPATTSPIRDSEQDLYRTLRTRLDQGRGDDQPPCRIGVGSPCTESATYPQSYREAILAVASDSGRDTAPSVDALGVAWLMSQIPEQVVQAYGQRMLGDLRSYDVAHGTELVDSLRAYIEARCDAVAASRELQIHANTMRYRLQRIQEITTLDLSDPEVRFGLELAVRTQA